MITTISIILCKMVTYACHLFNREGSVFPGKCVTKIQRKVLKKIHYPEQVVVVTGSSGKGSTVAMIAHILEESGRKVIWNKSGSNVKNAIVTLVLNNAHALTHKVEADVLLLEMDERYLEDVFAPGTVTHMCVTNITRDQPARNFHPDVIYFKITDSFDKQMHLIINGDDPIVSKIRYGFSNPITTYGIDKTPYDTDYISYSVDGAYCPSCHNKIKYDTYHYGHLGIYDCPKCSFTRGKIDYEAKKVDLKKGTFELDGETLKLNKKVFFAVYYTLLAYTVCVELGIDKKTILKSINDHAMASKRMKSFELDGRNLEMLESKNENALSYMQSLNYIKNDPEKKAVVMGFENVSRRYRYNDLSWLWDINFESLANDSVDKIFLIGRFNTDVAVCLDYAGIPEEKIIMIDDVSTLLDKVANESTGNIYTMVCFDMTEKIRNMLEERENGKN